ncbi:MAG: D-aminoacyl-tRNA deacylase [Aureliella sp.]
MVPTFHKLIRVSSEAEQGTMRAVIQRVTSADVTVDGETVGAIQRGLVILLGVAQGDDQTQAVALAEKIVGLRIFADEAGKMNLSLQDVGGSVLVVSQFTLLADVRKGKRPSFIGAAPPAEAKQLYEDFCTLVASHGVPVSTGRFAADMQVRLINDGPVTIVLDM